MSPVSKAILDPEVLEALLQLIGPEVREATLIELVSAWDESSKNHIESLRGTRCLDEIRRAVHALKGATAQLGGVALVTRCRRVEALIDEGEGAALDIEELRVEIARERKELLDALRSHFALA
jgi:HPt (histidine-containing phosphotransfer) domain-containing protein